MTEGGPWFPGQAMRQYEIWWADLPAPERDVKRALGYALDWAELKAL